ncbi:MAG TPA: DUF1570 domain-containing protein [Kofleriaceae bacterium]|nr:DUF1570 domain-containing protein [Kofleriaceae bacterium]
MTVARGLLAVLGAAACGSSIPALPSRGGPAWSEVKSEHFTLWTDAPVAQGHLLVRKMEHHRQVILRAMNDATSSAHAFVIALGSAREVNVYLPNDVIASAWPAGGPTREAGVVLDAYTRDNDHVFSHELSHVISFGLIAHQPHWLSEGIATYFEMAELDPSSTSTQIGVPREDRARYLRGRPAVPIHDLFACREHSCMDGAFYATSWAVVSYLLNQHFDELGRYFQLLNSLPRERIDEAWPSAFPHLSPNRLDRELREWLVSGTVRLPRIEVAVTDLPTTERPLGDADALAVRALLQLMFTPDLGKAHDLLGQALARDRTHVLARLVEAALPRVVTPAEAQAVVDAHPDDWRAWWLLALATPRGATRRAVVDHLCTITHEERELCAHRDQPPQSTP